MSAVNVSSGYLQVVGGLSLAAAGMALAFPAATEAIVGSLPQDKAGVASAVNDTTREVGAAVGIALLGSLMSSGYRRSVGDAFDALPAAAAEAAGVEDPPAADRRDQSLIAPRTLLQQVRKHFAKRLIPAPRRSLALLAKGELQELKKIEGGVAPPKGGGPG